MTIRLVLIMFSLLLVNVCSAQKTILIIGDSLSSGYNMKIDQSWVSLLQLRLTQHYPQYQIINQSTSGDTTANGLNQFTRRSQQEHSDIVILELGANDGLRGLSLAYVQKNLERIIKKIQQQKSKIVLLGMQIPPNYGKKYTQAFAAIYPQLAKKYQLTLVPFMLAGVAGNTELIQQDGLHPNVEAQKIILENIWPYLIPLLEPE